MSGFSRRLRPTRSGARDRALTAAPLELDRDLDRAAPDLDFALDLRTTLRVLCRGGH